MESSLIVETRNNLTRPVTKIRRDKHRAQHALHAAAGLYGRALRPTI